MTILQKTKKQLSWAQLAEVIGHSKERSITVLLGQMTPTETQTKTVGAALDLPEETIVLLQVTPYKGPLSMSVPTDPLVYRFYGLINVHGTTSKVLIHEEFGDGIMNAIDFSMDPTYEPDPKDDHARIIMSGKFLPYKIH